MPEGDSVIQAAQALRPRLAGRRLSSVRTRGERLVEDLSGDVVASVATRGKHLLLDTEGGFGLRVHLGMKGKWHRYSPGKPWRRPRWQASLVLETEADVLVCFAAKEVEVARHPARWFVALERVGPDLLLPLELDDLVARARATSPARPLLDVLLDQWIAAGLGNVFKSEVLFLCGRDPRTAQGELSDAELRALFAEGARLIRANAPAPPRVTRGEVAGERPRRPGEARYHVYGRGGLPCFRCQTPIERALLGSPPRSTYWCPTCQEPSE